MDEDIMSRSSYGKVIFNTVDWTLNHLICKFYPKYIYEEMKTSVSASVGLYRVLQNNPDDYVIKQDIFIAPQHLGEDIQLEFERSKLPYDEKSFYHFQFINEKGEVMGASTPFKIRVPSSPTESHESDEFVVIDQDLKYDGENQEIQTETKNPSSFVVLSEQCKSLEVKDVSKSVISDSVSSLTESMNIVQPSEDNDETSGESISSHKSLLDSNEEKEEKKREEEEEEETTELLSEERSRLKDLLQKANDTIEMNEKQISQLQKELQIKDKKIEELNNFIDQREAQRSRDYDVKEFQTLHKLDQLKIYELETEIKKMDEVIKQNNSLNHLKFEDINKSIHELQSSNLGETCTVSSTSGHSLKNMDPHIIQKFMMASMHKISQLEDEDNASQVTIEASSVASKPENASLQATRAASLTSKPENIPRILDDGRVVMENNCPFCGKVFDASDENALTMHVNNHLPIDSLECPMCDLKFEIGQQSELEEHVQIHLDDDSDDDLERVTVNQKEKAPQAEISTFGAVKSAFQFLHTLGK